MKVNVNDPIGNGRSEPKCCTHYLVVKGGSVGAPEVQGPGSGV